MICENCGKEHNGSYGSGRFCCKSCANTRHHKKEIIEQIKNALKTSDKYQKYLNKIHTEKELNLNKRRKNIFDKAGRFYCGSKELDEQNFDISRRQSPKWFKKLIPFGFDINSLYTEQIIEEHKKVKDLLYNEYVVNCLSPKDIYDKYNCKEYFKHFETLLHIFKDWNFPIRSYSKAVHNAWLTGNLELGNIYVQYKSDWHTTWNNKEVFLRSSFELDYAKELDEQKIDYEVEYFHIKYFDTKIQEYRCAIPDFYIPSTNTIVEIKSNYTLDKQNMKDKMKAYKDLGYNFKLICDHKEISLEV